MGYFGKQWMFVLFLVISLVTLLTLLWQTRSENSLHSSYVNRVGREPHKCPESAITVQQRRRIASTISDIQMEIARVAGTTAVVDAKWALVLRALAAELDPRIPSTQEGSWDFSARLPNMPMLPNRSTHVCPEVYFGNKFDRPFFQHGMEQEACKEAPPFRSVLTAIIPGQSWTNDAVTFVLQQIRKVYHIPIIALVKRGANPIGNISGVVFVEVETDVSDAENLNAGVQRVTTPFVMVGESLAHFSNQSSLERLVRVLDDLQVQVAGGAGRDTHGHWIHGCVQQHMANYQAKYTMGYYYSKYECMYCDDLLTPFVTRTSFLVTLPFTAGLTGQAMYRDWFAKVRDAGHLAVVCPDVMFFLRSHVNMTAQDWWPMARQWALETVHSFDDQLHTFSCAAVGISCKQPLSIIQSYLLPLCCVKEMEEQIGYVLDYAEKHNLEYEMHAGSALSVIKMGQYLPWDFDADIAVDCNQMDIWMKMNSYLQKKKLQCKMSVHTKGIYLQVHCRNFFVELFCNKGIGNTRAILPPEYRDIPTKALQSSRLVNVRSNPGLYSRNYIGFEAYRHAAHWRTLEVSDEGKAKGGYDSPGTWNKCKKQRHHSCLDKYPGDGNLPFTKPFLRP